MIQTITMPDNWNLIFRDELCWVRGYIAQALKMQKVFEINVNYIPSLEKFFIENVQQRNKRNSKE